VVEMIGGKLEFTDEVTFSSTQLLNENFNVFTTEAEEYLRDMAQRYTLDDLKILFDKMSDWSVAVVGDTIVDEYTYVRPMGRVEKAPIVACRFLDTEFFAGGVLAVANHIANFVKKVDLITIEGNDDLFSKVESKLAPNIKLHLHRREDGPTILKRRYLHKEDLKKMFALEFMNDRPIPAETETAILKQLPGVLDNSDLTVAADFGHGTITQQIINQMEKSASFLATNAQTNSSNFGFNLITRFPKSDFISIDETELRLATTGRFDSIEDMLCKLRKTICCPKINITLGAKGTYFFTEKEGYFAPAFASSVLDTVGAGDAVLSVLSLCVAAGFPDEVMPFVGNCAGAIAANILCNESTIGKSDLFKMIKTSLSWR
jgi:bifunctional ADP-heptose synthase (sugar kinase/adenylyltransferase)